MKTGKAESLEQMKKAGFNVPDFFIVEQRPTKETSDTFLAKFDALKTKSVAVRSSTNVEDGEHNSWAGQFTSHLNVAKENLIEKINSCFDSVHTTNVTSYKNSFGIEKEISMNVIVQKMIHADYAGVAFSVNPITKKSDVLIEVVKGTGESLVSGKVTPQTYHIDKTTKQIDIVSSDSSDTLNSFPILQLFEIILKIESFYNFPCDIEWAYEKDTFYILQCRPITTIKDTDLIESYIATQRMISLGTRGPDTLEAKLKIMGWSTNFKKEFGVGYRTIVINSEGKQYGDFESLEKIDFFFDNRDISFAKKYIKKMSDLNSDLNDKILRFPDEEFIEELSYLFTYFSAIRWTIENVYKKSSAEDKKLIDDWRNDETIFSSLELYGKVHPLSDPDSWSVVGIDDQITILPKVINCAIKSEASSSHEIKGQTAYPGIISGTARVALTDEIRDSIKEGDIIVAPMTTLDFTHAMSIAAGFVTDEGGITCHAAIVARELKKPCIIGTRNGTQIIKDGDIVELDATNGIVRILNVPEA